MWLGPPCCTGCVSHKYVLHHMLRHCIQHCVLILPSTNQVDGLIAVGTSIAALAGAANPVAVLNTPETSFAVADSRQINVSPPSATSVMVQRNLIAAAGRAGQYYLSAEDALKVSFYTVTSNNNGNPWCKCIRRICSNFQPLLQLAAVMSANHSS